MKIRLIEPEPPGMHVYAKVLLPRLGLPIIAATLKAHGHDVLIYNPQMAPIDWDDVQQRRPRRPFEHHIHGRRRPTSSPTACAPAASP